MSIGGNPIKKLFQEIVIQQTTISVEQWHLYNRLMQAAEAFSKSILIKSDQEIVDLLNKAAEQSLARKDFTGKVVIGYTGPAQDNHDFLVHFELTKRNNKVTDPDSLALKLTTNTDNNKQNPHSLQFVHKENTYYIYW